VSAIQRLGIFISSTTKDLQPERDAVEQAISDLNLEAVRSEKVGSQSISPREACRIMAQECDVYLGILGGRYGSKLEEGRSATEFEFDTAHQAGKPILLYRKRVPEDELEPEQKTFIERVDDFETGYYIRDFTLNHVPDQLIGWVQQDIVALLAGDFKKRMPEAKPRPGPPSGRRVLIASLGCSPGAVTGLAHALIQTGTPIDRVRTVSTSEYQVQRAVKVVREDLKAQGLTDYEDVCISSADITNDRDVRDFKRAFARFLIEARQSGDEAAIGIAGGRTVMGALLTLVAQMEAPSDSYLYQLSVPNAVEEDGRIPAFFNQSPQRRQEVLRPLAHYKDQCHLVKAPFVHFEFEED
jgi:hypothetical protein